jgi:hypothetical protein
MIEYLSQSLIISSQEIYYYCHKKGIFETLVGIFMDGLVVVEVGLAVVTIIITEFTLTD